MMCRPFHLACALLLLGFMRLGAAELRLMQNLDGDLSFVGATPQESKEKLQRLVNDIADGPAKTLMWSIGAGSDILYYQTKVASTWGWRLTKYHDDPKWGERIRRCQVATEAGLDAPRIVGETARDRGLEFVPSYRMNDAHYCSDPLNYPLTGRFWMEHQDASIGASPVAGWEGYKYLLDYAREDVRAYRLGVIFEAMDRYADLMNGFELDFNRFQVFFKPGAAAQHAPLITAMVKQAREHLHACSDAQHRPMKLYVRVPPAVKNCAWAGLEVEKWMREKLVDAVIPAQVMTLSHDMPLEDFVSIAKASDCEVIGSLYGRSGYAWPFKPDHSIEAYSKEVSRTPTAPQFLGAALNQRFQGASGHQVYNFILHSDTSAVKALTSLEGVRRYQITQSYFHDREDTYEYRKQVPAPLLAGKPATLRLLIGQDPKAGTPHLRIGLHGANQAYDHISLAVTINSHALRSGPAQEHIVVTKGVRHGIAPCPATEAYVQWPISDSTLLHEGWNEITVTLKPGSKPDALQIVETEIAIVPLP